MATREEKFGDIIQVPGMPWGFRWENVAGWVLYPWVSVQVCVNKKGTGEYREEWGDACYPVDFRHMAKIIARGAGANAATVNDLLQNIITERERLEKVLEEIIAATNKTQQAV